MNLISKFPYKTFKNQTFLAVVISVLTYFSFYHQLLKPNNYFYSGDAINYYIPARFYFYEKVIEDKTFPFWTERLYLGFPVFADIEMGYWHLLNNLLIIIFGPLLSYKIIHFGFYLIGSISLFLLLKKYQINLWGFTASNIVYFFTFFMTLHQIHYNIVLTFYLFPLSIYLIEKYLIYKKFKYIFYQALTVTSSLLLGHTQSTFIYLLGLIIYFVLRAEKKELLKQSFIYLFISSMVVLIISLPQLLPTYKIYQESLRKETLNYKQGSLLPSLTSLVFIPNLFGTLEKYEGFEINPSYMEYETYIYAGVSAFLIGVLTIFTKAPKIFKTYFLISCYLFIFLATLSSNLYFQDSFIIGLFRYWQRSVILFSFTLALLVGYYVSSLEKLDFNKNQKYFIFLAPPLIYLHVINHLNNYQSLNLNIINSLFKNFTWVYLLVTILTLITFFIINLRSKIINFKSLIQGVLILIIFIDLYYFSKPYINQTISPVSLTSFDYSKFPQNSRIYFENPPIDGLSYLYLKSWSMIGYSNFLQAEYYNYLLKNNLLPTDLLVTKNITFKQDILDKLHSLGISRIFLNNQIKEIEYPNLELIQRELEAKYLIKKEGHLEFEYWLENSQQINTKLRYSDDWEIKINNQPTEGIRNEIFLSFMSPAGKNSVTIKYVPSMFYLGLKISALLTLVLLIAVWVWKKKGYQI